MLSIRIVSILHNVDIAKKTKSELQKATLSIEQKLAKNIKGDTKSFLRMSEGKLKLG